MEPITSDPKEPVQPQQIQVSAPAVVATGGASDTVIEISASPSVSFVGRTWVWIRVMYDVAYKALGPVVNTAAKVTVNAVRVTVFVAIFMSLELAGEVKLAAKAIANEVRMAAKATYVVLNAMIDMTYEFPGGDGVYKVFKLAYAVQLYVAYNSGNLSAYAPLANMCTITMTGLDAFRFFGETRGYFSTTVRYHNGEAETAYGRDRRKNYLCNIGGMGVLAVTNALTTVDTLRSLNLIDLSKISATLGNTALSSLVDLGMEATIRYTLIAALILFGMDSLHKIYRGKNTVKPIANLAYGTAEVLFQKYVLQFGSSLSSVDSWNVRLGLAAAITSFISGVVHTARIKPWTKNPESEVHVHPEMAPAGHPLFVKH